jgi:hypothetical protein
VPLGEQGVPRLDVAACLQDRCRSRQLGLLEGERVDQVLDGTALRLPRAGRRGNQLGQLLGVAPALPHEQAESERERREPAAARRRVQRDAMRRGVFPHALACHLENPLDLLGL